MPEWKLGISCLICGCSVGLVVSVLAIYSDEPSLNPIKVYNFVCDQAMCINFMKNPPCGCKCRFLGSVTRLGDLKDFGQLFKVWKL